ncbi:unnamed protein product [Scytosiphon promiscuus]
MSVVSACLRVGARCERARAAPLIAFFSRLCGVGRGYAQCCAGFSRETCTTRDAACFVRWRIGLGAGAFLSARATQVVYVRVAVGIFWENGLHPFLEIPYVRCAEAVGVRCSTRGPRAPEQQDEPVFGWERGEIGWKGRGGVCRRDQCCVYHFRRGGSRRIVSFASPLSAKSDVPCSLCTVCLPSGSVVTPPLVRSAYRDRANLRASLDVAYQLPRPTPPPRSLHTERGSVDLSSRVGLVSLHLSCFCFPALPELCGLPLRNGRVGQRVARGHGRWGRCA